MADKRHLVIAFLVIATIYGCGTFSPLGGQAVADTWFGIQGSISGDTYLVGQRFGDGVPGSQDDVGSVHVFVREDATSWPETTTLESLLEPESLTIGAEFGGGAVLIDGDTAVVGAYRNTVDEAAQAGNAFVFTRSGSTWTPQTVLEMPGGATANARFGAAGDIDGNRLLLSAAGTGNAYVFTKSGENWDSGVELSGGTIGNPIGVAIDGNLAAVGNYGSNPHVDLWRYNQTSDSWDFESAIANPGAADNLLGTSIDISGNTMVVSARQEMVDGSAHAGAVYIYGYADESWTLQQTIENPDPAVNDEFGYDVAIEGNRLAIGAPRDDTNETDAGLTYLFELTGSTWALAETYSPETPEAGKWFGEIVDMSGDVLLAGGPGRSADPIGSGDAFWFEMDSIPVDPDIPGDANRDGTVNVLDAEILASNWMGGGNPTWAEGDFNDDGLVNEIDATIMSANWQAGPITSSTVPEPGTLALLLGLASVALLFRRK